MRMKLRHLWLSSILVLVGPLLLACGGDKPVSSSENPGQEPIIMTSYDPNQSVSSPENPGQEPSVRTTNEVISIEGEITQVMESWPLQLIVQTQNGRYYVGLLPETKITRRGQKVDPNKLNSGLRVKIQGQPSASANQLAMTAKVIEIK